MAYSDKVIDHLENPCNVGSLDRNDPDGTSHGGCAHSTTHPRDSPRASSPAPAALPIAVALRSCKDHGSPGTRHAGGVGNPPGLTRDSR